MAITPQTKTWGAVWLDVNTKTGMNGKPDLLPNVQAINNSLFNLFNCSIGARGPIFQPEYGTGLMNLLHEPLDFITANKIRIVFIQAIQRWEPRITVDMLRTSVTPVLANQSYQIQIYYSLVGLGANGSASLSLVKK